MALTRIQSARKLRRFLVYDLEWVPGSLDVRLVGCFDGKRYRAYSSVLSFIENELTSKNRGAWFYAHAGGLADVQFVFEWLLKDKGWKVHASFSGSSAIIVHVAKGKNAFHFVDSYWLLRDKLKNIGKWIGLEKGEPWGEERDEEELSDEEFDSLQERKREWYSTAPIHELREYNERDCEVLWRAINAFEDTLLDLGGQLQMTIASSAMHLFRRRFLTRNIETDETVNAKARFAYFASRVEVFEREISDALYFDINSSFPYAMTKPCPGDVTRVTNRLPDNPDAIYLADVRIEVPEAYLTPAPFRIDGRVFFPSGVWRSWLTSVDIQLIQREGGRILNCYECIEFAPFDDLRAYSNTVYDLRKNATTDFEKVVLKFLLNALYGKFAESPFKRALVINPVDTFASGLEMLMPGVWLEERKVPIPHMHVPVSAHVTAMARLTLYDYMAQCRRVHYCDTDGFSTNDTLSTGKNLGDLKLEKVISHGYFKAPKVYQLEGQVQTKDGAWKEKTITKAKGFSRMTASRFATLLEGEQIDFERMRRLRELYRSGNTHPVEYKVKKRLLCKSLFDDDFNPGKHSITKRFTYPDGGTRPWQLGELRRMFNG